MGSITGTFTAVSQDIDLSPILQDQNVTLTVEGTYSGLEMFFEVSTDGTNFFPMGLREGETDAINSSSTLLPDNDSRIWSGVFRSAIAQTFRVRSVAFSSGTANIEITSTTPEAPEFSQNTTSSDGRLRVAEPFVKASESFSTGIPLVWDSASTGAGTFLHDSDEQSGVLNTGGTSTSDETVVQTIIRFTHNQGIMTQVVIASVMGSIKTNVRQRLGFYDTEDGFFFEQDGTDLKVVRRSSATGSTVDTSVAQSSWNIDKLDGTGTSGVIIDLSQIQNFLIEFEHAGGLARYGFRLGGKTIYCHQFESANTITLPLTAWSVFPIRAEIENTGVASSATQLRLYSMSIIEEGSVNIFRQSNTINLGTNTFDVSSTTDTPVMSIRVKSTGDSPRTAFLPSDLKALIVNNADTLIKAYFDPVLTGASWASASNNVEFDVSATSFTGGVESLSFYITTNESIQSAVPLTVGGYSTRLDGTAVIVTVTAAKVGANGNLLAAMSYEEVI